MFELDVRSRKPIYEQLVERIKELIMAEILKKDEQLPSVRTLALQLMINPNTIQKAYRELENQGYIYSIQGRGSFINQVSSEQNAKKLEEVKSKLMKLVSEALYLGMSVDDLVLFIKKVEKTAGGGGEND